MFPVGLGLKNLFISALFLVLIFGLVTPIFGSYKSRKTLVRLVGLSALFFFGLATYNSDFNEDRKKPNSIVFINDVDNNQSYWATYDRVPDAYTTQFLGENPTKETLQEALLKASTILPTDFIKKQKTEKFWRQ